MSPEITPLEFPGLDGEEARSSCRLELQGNRVWLRVGWSANVSMPTHWASIGLTREWATNLAAGLLRLAKEIE
jgi:hypothetical protein